MCTFPHILLRDVPLGIAVCFTDIMCKTRSVEVERLSGYDYIADVGDTHLVSLECRAFALS